MLCMAGFLTLRLSVRVCVRFQNIQKNVEPINFIFGGSLPSNPWRKPFDFEKNHRGVRVGVEGSKFGPNHANDKR